MKSRGDIWYLALSIQAIFFVFSLPALMNLRKM